MTVGAGRVLSSPLGFTSEGFSLQLNGLPGEQFLVQTSVDLVAWADWRLVEIGDDPFTIVDSEAGQEERRFYRAISPSP